MKVFVTGASGFVGSAVAEELIAHGHKVAGLARSAESAAKLEAMGAEAVAGTIQDLELLTAQARAADAVAHLAFNHDFTRYEANAADDGTAIRALGAGLVGTDKPMLVTSGLAIERSGPLGLESDRSSAHFPRLSEIAGLEVAATGVRCTAVRLAPTTHGAGDHGFVPTLIGIAREKGVSAYVGEGLNRWPAVHRRDAAALYRLALERGADGGPYHAVAEEGLLFKDIAAAIGRGLGVPVVSVAPEAADVHFGWFSLFAQFDIPASSARTREVLGWRPVQPDLLDDMAAHYFG